MREITQILSQIESDGDAKAIGQLLPLVYDELRKLAAVKLAQEQPGQTLQATALVHEAYLRLFDGGKQHNWDCQGHFFSAAAEAMRRILIDRARQKRTVKHGGQFHRIDLRDLESQDETSADDLMALDLALSKLEQKDPVKAELVKLRYFAGLTTVQAARALGIGVSTAEKYWAYAKSWLRTEITQADRNSNRAE